MYNFGAVSKQDAGKYMVKAVNEAGETQSIADFIVVEATPDQTIDIVNTISVESTEGQRVCHMCSSHISNYQNIVCFYSEIMEPLIRVFIVHFIH